MVAFNVAVVFGVASLVYIMQTGAQDASVPLSYNFGEQEDQADPLDALSSADIAVNIANLVKMDQVTAVTNNADSINAQLAIVPSDSQVVAKPQIVSTESKSVNDVQTYVAVQGDTITSIAERFGVSQDAIRWSNDLTGDAVAVGVELQIPPVEGFVYTVAADDTAEVIAERFSADQAELIAFNDAEITGLQAGAIIVVPNGSVPTPRFSAPIASGFRFGTAAVYGYNGYDRGYCTWYAANKRAEIGRPIPANLGNASTWKSRAQLAGIPVGNTPEVGAVIWTPPRDYYGHVGFVEEVLPDGSVRVSEMNVRGWNMISERIYTPEQAALYSYIY